MGIMLSFLECRFCVVGEPLEGFQSTNGFVSNANNDIDFDNNGYGNPFTDIMSGIVLNIRWRTTK